MFIKWITNIFRFYVEHLLADALGNCGGVVCKWRGSSVDITNSWSWFISGWDGSRQKLGLQAVAQTGPWAGPRYKNLTVALISVAWGKHKSLAKNESKALELPSGVIKHGSGISPISGLIHRNITYFYGPFSSHGHDDTGPGRSRSDQVTGSKSRKKQLSGSPCILKFTLWLLNMAGWKMAHL